MPDFKFTIPIVGKIVAYIYDFCTYKKIFNIRLLFEDANIKDNYYFFNLRIINNMSYNIKITKIYTKTGCFLLENNLNEKFNDDGLKIYEYLNQLQKTIELECKDTEENHFILGVGGSSKNKDTINIKYKDKQTKIYIEYEIKDIIKSLFISKYRIKSFVIPM